MAETLSYEDQRLQNIRDNQALLFSLGLAAPARPALKRLGSNVKKRKSEVGDAINISAKKTPRPSRIKEEDEEYKPSLRRSARNVGRPSIDKRRRETGDDSADSDVEEESESDGEYVRKGNNPKQRNNPKMGARIHDPKTFGHIPDVPVGKWWATRMEASTDAIHAPTVAGISGNAIDGAYSVALSGGYADDIDLGVAFTYTGCGGRDLKGTKQNPKNLRTAPQTFNQSFDWPYNAALKRSAETRQPVRVIRGFKLDSPFAPATGYRYDGLYVVEKAWMAKGLTKGLLVCRYAFKRLPGQPDLITRDEDDEP